MTRRTLLFAAAVVSLLACSRGPNDPSSQSEVSLDDPLVGTKPPEWTTKDWHNSPPLTLRELRGRVVLVRFFMGTACPYCSATAPSLKKLHHEYAPRGLVVVGLYHHRDDGALVPGQLDGYVKSYGFDFPVARDPEWKTLDRWWLTRDREFTSATFILDREGVVRGVHPGPRFEPGDAHYEAIRNLVEKLLATPST